MLPDIPTCWIRQGCYAPSNEQGRQRTWTCTVQLRWSYSRAGNSVHDGGGEVAGTKDVLDDGTRRILSSNEFWESHESPSCYQWNKWTFLSLVLFLFFLTGLFWNLEIMYGGICSLMSSSCVLLVCQSTYLVLVLIWRNPLPVGVFGDFLAMIHPIFRNMI